jgi:hypothetical protein
MHWAMVFGTDLVALTSPMLAMQILAAIALLLSIHAWLMRRAYNLPHRMNGDRPNPYLIVRKGWAWAAFVADCSFVFLAVPYSVAMNVAVRAQGISVMHALSHTPPLLALVGSALPIAYFGLIVLLHWLATRPGKPKRVKLPRRAVLQGAA